MYSDSVLEELWRIKDENAAKYGYDVHAMAAALRNKQREGEDEVVSLATAAGRPKKRPVADTHFSPD